MMTWMRIFLAFALPGFLCATPVTYVYFGEKWIERYHEDYSQDEKAAFILGVVFPDIRYLNIRMPREPNPADISQAIVLGEENPFEQGRLFHYFFLQFRNSTVERLNLYEQLTSAPEGNKDLLLMLLEDHYFYDEIDRPHVKKYFDNVIEDEEYMGIPFHTLRTWHRIITQYYGMSPFAIVRRLRQFDLGMFGAPKETVAEWSREFPALLESEPFQVYISELDSGFGSLIQ